MHRQAAQGPQQSDRLRRESDCVVGVCVGGSSLNGLSVRPLGLIVAGGPLVLIRVFLTLDLCVKRVKQVQNGGGNWRYGEDKNPKHTGTTSRQIPHRLCPHQRQHPAVEPVMHCITYAHTQTDKQTHTHTQTQTHTHTHIHTHTHTHTHTHMSRRLPQPN